MFYILSRYLGGGNGYSSARTSKTYCKRLINQIMSIVIGKPCHNKKNSRLYLLHNFIETIRTRQGRGFQRLQVRPLIGTALSVALTRWREAISPEAIPGARAQPHKSKRFLGRPLNKASPCRKLGSARPQHPT